MKKFIYLISMIILVFTLVACNNDEDISYSTDVSDLISVWSADEFHWEFGDAPPLPADREHLTLNEDGTGYVRRPGHQAILFDIEWEDLGGGQLWMKYIGVHLSTESIYEEVTRGFRVSGNTLTFIDEGILPTGERSVVEHTFSRVIEE